MRGENTFGQIPRELQEKAIWLYSVERMSANEIKRHFGIDWPWSSQMIYHILKKYNIPRRPKNVALRIYVQRCKTGGNQLELPI